jgi:hypothetical protein
MSRLTFIKIGDRILFRWFINTVIFLIKLPISMKIGLVIKGMFQASVVGGGTTLLYDAHDYTSLPKPKGSNFSKIFLEVVRKKETLLSSDVDEGHY